jgi:hypothetical protein
MKMGLPCALAAASAFGKSVMGLATVASLANNVNPQATSVRSCITVNFILSFFFYNG